MGGGFEFETQSFVINRYLFLRQQYGGFYKHQVENCLSGAEKLFQQMGYVSSGQETLELNGPVDQDQATVVARDCILAYVECQVNSENHNMYLHTLY